MIIRYVRKQYQILLHLLWNEGAMKQLKITYENYQIFDYRFINLAFSVRILYWINILQLSAHYYIEQENSKKRNLFFFANLCKQIWLWDRRVWELSWKQQNRRWIKPKFIKCYLQICSKQRLIWTLKIFEVSIFLKHTTSSSSRYLKVWS